MKKLNIAIIGLGNIGSYLFKFLKKNKKILSKKNNCTPNIVYVSAKTKKRKRGFKINNKICLNNYLDATKKKNVDLIVELIGGAEGPAKKLVFNALKNKKHVVTANKALIAKYGSGNCYNLHGRLGVALVALRRLVRRAVPAARHAALVVAAAADAEDDVEVLVVVELVLEEELPHLEEGRLREERVRARLVLGAGAVDLEVLRHLVQPALEVVAVPHQPLDVVDPVEVELQLVRELLRRRRQLLAREELEEVAEVVPRVERHPLDVVAEHDPRRDEQLGEVERVDPLGLVPRKVDPRAREQVDRVLRVHVLAEREVEVELERAHAGRELALLVAEGEAELDDCRGRRRGS